MRVEIQDLRRVVAAARRGGRRVVLGGHNAAQRVLGVRATHGDDLPEGMRIYAFAASLGGERVLAAARALAKQSDLPAGNVSSSTVRGLTPTTIRPPRAPGTRLSTRSCRGCGAWAGARPGSHFA